MDFFDHQDRARRITRLLVFYFVVAVACIVASIYVASILIFAGSRRAPGPGEPERRIALWDPRLFAYAVTGTLVVVAAGSLYKTAELARGGSVVAESLGGRLILPNTTDLDELKLRNVIEEMAIASGVPVPKIYVLDREDGINAFAAGHGAGDAAIGVTRGCMTLLDRDELQGVIGHEFSHILNGDMRLNLRLLGVIFGILCLTVIGRVLIYARGDRDRNTLVLLGIVLIAVGAIGAFFGRLIQAALSRQREFLADASAVQFTRNPSGLSRALQKIGAGGSRIRSAHAEEASHMFFGNGLGPPLLGAMATHPPLEARIRAIDPGWDGSFAAAPPPAGGQRPPVYPDSRDMAALASGLAAGSVMAGSVVPDVGRPTQLHLRYAVALRNSFSEAIRSAARDPLGATALIYALFLSADAAVRADQITDLARRTTPGVSRATALLWPEVAPVAARARLPLVNLALPALRLLDPAQFRQFDQALGALIPRSGSPGVFEFVLLKIVRRHLAPGSGKARTTASKPGDRAALLSDFSVVLSALAHAGGDTAADAGKAFRTGTHRLGADFGQPRMLPPEQSGLAQFDASLDRLASASAADKRSLIDACAHVVGADGLIQERESELLRAIAETLECPLPPFVDPAA